MQDTLVPVSQTAVTRELQISKITNTFLLSMTELGISGSSVRRWGPTVQPPSPYAGCFSLIVETEHDIHAAIVPRAHI